MELKTRLLGGKSTSLLGLGGALLGVAAAWGWVSPEQATGLAGVFAAIGGLLKA